MLWRLVPFLLLWPFVLAATRADEAETHLSRGIALVKLNRNQDAVAEFRQAQQISPDRGLIRRYLGNALANLGRYEEAMAAHREAIRLNPYDAEAHYILGVVLARLGRWSDCVREWAETLRIDPNHQNALNWLPVARTRSRIEAALLLKPTPKHTVVPKALKPSPSPTPPAAAADFESHFSLARTLHRQGQNGEALSEYLAALQININSAPTHYGLADLYARLGHWAEAVHEYEETLRLDPYHGEAPVQLPQARDRLRAQATLPAPPTGLTIYSDRPSDFGATEVHFRLGRSLFGQERYEEALTEYRESLRYIPDSSAAHYNLGLALFKLRRYAEAAAAFQLAVRIRPDDAQAHYFLGVNLEQLGQKAEAAREFEQYLEYDPHAPSATQMRAHIHALRQQP